MEFGRKDGCQRDIVMGRSRAYQYWMDAITASNRVVVAEVDACGDQNLPLRISTPAIHSVAGLRFTMGTS